MAGVLQFPGKSYRMSEFDILWLFKAAEVSVLSFSSSVEHPVSISPLWSWSSCEIILPACRSSHCEYDAYIIIECPPISQAKKDTKENPKSHPIDMITGWIKKAHNWSILLGGILHRWKPRLRFRSSGNFHLITHHKPSSHQPSSKC